MPRKYGGRSRGRGRGFYEFPQIHSLNAKGIKTNRKISMRDLKRHACEHFLLDKLNVPHDKKCDVSVTLSAEGIPLTDPRIFVIGSSEWQDAMIHNIREKLKREEPLGAAEKAFLSVQKGFIERLKKEEDQETERKIDDFFDITEARLHGTEVETKSTTEFKFPQEKKIIVKQKSLFLLGKFRDLFKYGKKVKIINVHGEVVRKFTLKDGKVEAWAGDDEPVIMIDADTDILYEPWFMDNGSLVFHAPKEMIGDKSHLFKLATEGDKVIVE